MASFVGGFFYPLELYIIADFADVLVSYLFSIAIRLLLLGLSFFFFLVILCILGGLFIIRFYLKFISMNHFLKIKRKRENECNTYQKLSPIQKDNSRDQFKSTKIPTLHNILFLAKIINSHNQNSNFS